MEDSNLIEIKKGIYASHMIKDKVFSTVDNQLHTDRNGRTFMKLLNSDYAELPRKILKVYVDKGDFKPVSKNDIIATMKPKIEDDAEIMAKIRKNFSLMEKMAQSCAEGQVKGLVISGAPGTGKSYNIQRVLENSGFENLVIDQSLLEAESESIADIEASEEMADKKYYVLCKGQVTPLALYMLLYQHSNAVIVFDDCDSVLMNQTSLNILKAALDSYNRRIISWNTRSVGNRVPRSFEYTGRVIFVSNIYFDQISPNSRLRMHIDAIMSRTHFLDLGMSTNKEKILRINQTIEDGLLNDFNMSVAQKKELVDFISKYQEQFREISLRTALKIADAMTIDPTNWKELALLTCTGGRQKTAFEY